MKNQLKLRELTQEELTSTKGGTLLDWLFGGTWTATLILILFVL